MINSVETVYTPDGTHVTSYKVTKSDGIIYSVPKDTANTDYQEIQQWIADGGTVIDNPPEETP